MTIASKVGALIHVTIFIKGNWKSAIQQILEKGIKISLSNCNFGSCQAYAAMDTQPYNMKEN